MAGAKETPRQKMIGMMYLVLTALLALNVSVDILDAFAIVNDNMEESNESFSSKMASQYAKFESQYNLNKSKVGDYWAKAQEVRSHSDSIINYIENIKLELVMRTEGLTREEIMDTTVKKPILRNLSKADSSNIRKCYEFNLKNIGAKDKYDAGTNYMITGESRKAYELEEKLNKYRNNLIRIVDGNVVYQMDPNTGDTLIVPGPLAKKISIKTNKDEYGKKIKYYDANNQVLDWENKNFYHMILAADITLLNKIISEIQNAEADAITMLYSYISEKDYKFDNVAAEVIPISTYILTGGKYQADVIVAAYDSKTQLKGKVLQGATVVDQKNMANATVYEGKEGKLQLEFPCNRIGEQKYAGVIEMMDPATNTLTTYPFSGSYTVAPPSVTVAPTKMNVFYQGVQNPISVSSPGVASSDINVSISHGKLISKGNGDYMVEVPLDAKTTTITATAKMNGKSVSLGSTEFRIKKAPNPIAKIANMTGGKITKATLNGAGAIIPVLEDFDFEGFHYSILSYEVSTIRGGDYQSTGTVRGNQFSKEVKNFINGASKGQKLYFEKIQAKGPDGLTRTLNPINLEIN